MREWTFRFPSAHAVERGEGKWSSYDHVVLGELIDGTVHAGVAFTSERDQYNRRRGWQVARGRMRLVLAQEGHPMVVGRKHVLYPIKVTGGLGTVKTAEGHARFVLAEARQRWGVRVAGVA